MSHWQRITFDPENAVVLAWFEPRRAGSAQMIEDENRVIEVV